MRKGSPVGGLFLCMTPWRCAMSDELTSVGRSMKLSHLLWSPVKEGETWALTFVRVAGNLIRWLVIFPAILFALALAGFGIYYWFDNRPAELNEVDGVRIGMTLDDVTVAKGEPEHKSNPELQENGSVTLDMRYGQTLIYLRGDDESNPTVRRVCDISLSTYETYNGVGAYTSEAQVRKRLGEPDRERIHNDKFGKAMTYERLNMIVHIEAGTANAVCIGVN